MQIMLQTWIMLTACGCTRSGSQCRAYTPLRMVVAAMLIMCVSGVSPGVVITTSLTGGVPDIVVGAAMLRVASVHQLQIPLHMH